MMWGTINDYRGKFPVTIVKEYEVLLYSKNNHLKRYIFDIENITLN